MSSRPGWEFVCYFFLQKYMITPLEYWSCEWFHMEQPTGTTCTYAYKVAVAIKTFAAFRRLQNSHT